MTYECYDNSINRGRIEIDLSDFVDKYFQIFKN